MSSHATVHMGPYVLCKTQQVPTPEKKRTCSNTKCGQYNSEVHDSRTKFCQGCGSPVAIREVSALRDKVNACEVRERLKERLTEVPGYALPTPKDGVYHIWMSNITRASKREQSFSPRDFVQLVPVTGDMIAEEEKEFKLYFHKELLLLHQQGYESVSVQWGLINYIN